MRENDIVRFHIDDPLCYNISEGGKLTKDSVWWNNGIKHKRSPDSPGPEWFKGRININNKLGGLRVKNGK